ncbi:DNA replication/repair protein RecF [Arabiibacter massiliensis]|uniref:DNA replication/repair protein RecF n=1 Tax=Arabiibacter massiliensis TaxID=1870985 RepID=UPI0009BBFC7C|nr:DNA replication and repair protein RecF [Arabiibacter massiliensis]
MDLSITHISFADFRSYERFDLAGIGPLTVLVGPNATGKTNIVEGVQLLTAQSSFRNPSPADLVRSGAAGARIAADVADGNRELELEMRVADGKRAFLLNGKPKRTADLKGILPSVTFTPDDLELAKGPQAVRRSALDALGSQLSANHYLIRRDYEKVIRHKNRLLKDEAPPALVAALDETLVTCGAQLACYRAALFEKLAASMASYYAEIVGGRERLRACYVPSWEQSDPGVPATFAFGRDEARASLAAALAARGAEERARRRALVGPHADRIEFFIGGRNVSTFASQGQRRSAVLAFKLAEAALIQDILHQRPVLLLDDVMSELDAERRRSLVAFVSGDIQTFITTANLDYFDEDLLAAARVVRLPLEEGSDGSSNADISAL